MFVYLKYCYIFAHMGKYLEFDVIVYLNKSSEEKEELTRLKEMGIPVSQEQEDKEERIVKYSFDPSTIIEIRQTFVKRGDVYLDSVVVSFTDHIYETPPLLISYEEFKIKLKQWNEANKEINEA